MVLKSSDLRLLNYLVKTYFYALASTLIKCLLVGISTKIRHFGYTHKERYYVSIFARTDQWKTGELSRSSGRN